MGFEEPIDYNDSSNTSTSKITLPPAKLHIPLTGSGPSSIPTITPASTVPPTPSTEFLETHLGRGELLNESNLPSVDYGRGAWTYLISVTVLEMIIWSWPASFGVFLEAYLDNPVYNSQKHAATLLPMIGTMSMGIMFLSGPVIYPLCSIYPYHRRLFLWGGTILCVVSLFCASFTTNVVALIILQGVLYALGGSLRYATCLSYFSEWFVQRQGFANGVVSAGSVAGGLFLPLIFPPLIASAGPEKTLRYISLFMVAVLIPTLPLIKGRLPESRVITRRPRPRGARGLKMFLEIREWMKGGTFWIVMVMNFSQGLGYFVPLLYLPTFATAIPVSKSNAAMTLALLNGSSIIGRLIFGHLCDLCNCWFLAFSTLVVTAISTFVLWGIFSNSFAGLVTFACVYGTVSGGWPSLWTGFLQGVAKDDPMALTPFFAYLMFSRGLANLLSAPISAAFYSHPHIFTSATKPLGYAIGDGKFGMMIIFVGICFVVGAGVTVVGWLWEFWMRGAGGVRSWVRDMTIGEGDESGVIRLSERE